MRDGRGGVLEIHVAGELRAEDGLVERLQRVAEEVV